MSGYLMNLVQRARGEGAMLQPRGRSRFEPGGWEEIEETSGATGEVQPSSLPPVVSLVQNTTTTSITNELPASNATVIIDRTSTSFPEPPEHESRREAGTTRVREIERTEATAHNVIERDHNREHLHTHDHVETRTIEHDQIDRLLREHLTIHHEQRSHTTAQHRERHTTRERESQNVQITIGRIDVRAIAPQPQSQRHESKTKAPTPLALDDYLRGKR